jgi:transposase
MRVVYRRCAGLDVHKDSVSACIRRRVKGSKETEVEEEVFSTCTRDLVRMHKWLRARSVKRVAMESTGVYWIPVWNVLEGGSLDLTLVNPATVRALQGKKTDRIDAGRIAEYLQYGLLSGSFVPPKPVRQLRELTRMRVHVQQDRSRVISRIGRLLETVNIKLGSVASDIVGKSGRSILRALAAGQDSAELLADRAVGSLRNKISALIPALEGRPDEHFRWMLGGLLDKLESLDQEVNRIDIELQQRLASDEDLLDRLATIPGVDRVKAQAVIAEVGDLSAFPDAAHLASWAGLCPGNAESAGKRFSGRTRKGNRYLRRILTQSAWAASRKKDSFLQAFYFRIAHRRGNRKALIAVAHRILTLMWKIIREGDVYRERGGNFFDRLNPLHTARKLSRRLEQIGFSVALATRPITPGILNVPSALDVTSRVRSALPYLPKCAPSANAGNSQMHPPKPQTEAHKQKALNNSMT